MPKCSSSAWRPTITPVMTQPVAALLGAHVVHVAELPARLGAHFAVEELGESHQAPGIQSTSFAARSSPRPSRSSGAVRFSLTTDETSSTSLHGTCTALPESAAASRPKTPRLRHALPPTRISVTSGSPLVEPVELEVVDVAAVAALAVDELMVEHPQAEIDLVTGAHP